MIRKKIVTLLILNYFTHSLLFAPPGDALYQTYLTEKSTESAPSVSLKQETAQKAQRSMAQEASNVLLPEKYRSQEQPTTIKKTIFQQVRHWVSDGLNRIFTATKDIYNRIFLKPKTTIPQETAHEIQALVTRPEPILVPETAHEPLKRVTKPGAIDQYPIWGSDSSSERSASDNESEPEESTKILGISFTKNMPLKKQIEKGAQSLVVQLLNKKTIDQNLESIREQALQIINKSYGENEAIKNALIKQVTLLLEYIRQEVPTGTYPSTFLLDNIQVQKLLGMQSNNPLAE